MNVGYTPGGRRNGVLRSASHAVAAGLVLGVMLLLAASGVRASEPDRVRVSWSGAPRCARPAGLLGRIASLIGTAPSGLAGKLVAFDAVVTRRAGRWRMRLALKTASGGGERSFAADSCPQLVDGAVLIAALAIDPDAVRVGRGGSRDRAAATPRIRLALRPLVRVDVGVLPAAGVSFGLAGALLWPALRLELDLSHGLPVGRSLRAGGAAVDLRLPIAGALRGCWRRRRGGRFELDLCLGATVGWLHGEGINIAEPRSGGSLWGAALGGGALSVAITKRWWIRLEGRGGASFARASFEIEGVGQAHQPAILVGQLGAGVEARVF